MRSILQRIGHDCHVLGLVAVLSFLAAWTPAFIARASERAINPANPSNPYGLEDLSGFSLGDYEHCKWGVWQDWTDKNTDTLESDWLTFGESAYDLESELFLTRSLTSLQFVSYSSLHSRSWNLPYGNDLTLTQYASPTPGAPLTLHFLRKLHFNNELNNGLWSPVPRSARKLIVFIHGWNPDANISQYWGPAFESLNSSIESAMSQAEDDSGEHGWEKALYEWEKDAATGDVLNDPNLGLTQASKINSSEVASIGYCHGLHLGELIRKWGNIEKVHFIAHSAGSWTAFAATQSLLEKSNIAVQITLLDPFVPGAIAENNTPLTKSRMELLPTWSAHPYSQLFLAENIFAIDNELLGTRSDLIYRATSQEFSWSSNRGVWLRVDVNSGESEYDSHDGPIKFYSDTVKKSSLGGNPSGLANFTTDLPNIGWQRSMFYREPQFKSQPKPVSDAKIGDQVQFVTDVVMRGNPTFPPEGLSLQWQVSVAGGSWQNTGSGATTLTIPSVTASHSGNKYRVIAYLNGLTEISQEATLTVINSTVASAPAAPTSLTAFTASSSRINLSWKDQSSNESGFKVRYWPDGSGSYSEILLPANTQNHSCSSLAASTKYYFQVYALNSVNSASGSNIANATTSAASTATFALTVDAVDMSVYQAIAVSMNSWIGLSTDFRSNTTSFTRTTTTGSMVSVTAPGTLSGGKYFQYWLLDAGSRIYGTWATVTMDGPHKLIAIYGSEAPAVRTLQSISIQGPPSVDERTATSYSARATYTDGTTGTVPASWDENSSYASISANGMLDSSAVSSDKFVTLSASATISGVTKSATKTVTIRNTDTKPTYSLDLQAANGTILASPDLRSYEAGTEVRLVARPDAGYLFDHWSGNASGTERTVYLTMNGDKSVSASFTPDTRKGYLQVNIQPFAAMAEGAQWRYRSYTEWNDDGYTQDGLPPGDGYVKFKDIPGWVSPERIPAVITGGQATIVNATYKEVPGNLQVSIEPGQAAQAGGRWRMDGGAWQESGVVLQNITPGSHTVDYLAVAGWTAPVAETIQIKRGDLSSRTGSYTPPPGLPIITNISPATGPLTGGTQVTIEGVNFSANATVQIGGLTAAPITFVSQTKLIATTPACESYGTVSVSVAANNQQTSVPNGFSYLAPLGSNMEMIGQLGGSYGAVKTVGNYAYVGEGTSLVIFDVTNPAAPVERGRIALPMAVGGIAVGNGKAYVANGRCGLYIVDVAVPTAPVIMGFYDTPGSARAVEIVGSIAYVADGYAGLQVIDVSNATAPRLIGSLDTPGDATRLSVGTVGAKMIACVTHRSAYPSSGTELGSLRIIEVTNPSSPSSLSTIPSDEFGFWGVKLAGTTLYTSSNTNGIRIYGVGTPATPSLLGSYSGFFGSDLDVQDAKLYAFEGNLGILNVTNPANPQKLGELGLGGFPAPISVSGSNVYVANELAGFQVVSVSTPSSPTLRATVKGVGAVNSLACNGTSLAITNSDGIVTIDATDPLKPVRKGVLGSSNILARGVALGNIFAFARNNDWGVDLIDASNPANPVLRSTYAPNRVWDVTSFGGTLLTGGYLSSASPLPLIDLVNIANPGSPQRIGTRQVSTEAYNSPFACISCSGNWGYFARSNRALDVIDLSNPANPIVAGKTTLTGITRGCAVSSDGNYVYIATDHGVDVVDVRTKSAPVISKTLTSPQNPSAIFADAFVNQNHLFTTDYDDVVRVFDISVPGAPVQVAFYQMPDVATGGTNIHAVGELVYVASGAPGLIVLKIKDLEKPLATISSPTTNSTHETSGSSISLAGSSSDNKAVVRVVWTNDRGGGGVAQGTSSWSIADVRLAAGTNRITVTAEDSDGNLGSDVIEVVCNLPDTRPPLIRITGPTTEPSLALDSSEVALLGSASDDRQMASVAWTTADGDSGTANLSNQTWSVNSVPLSEGLNRIQVVATDTAGNSSSAELLILRIKPDTEPPTVSIQFPTADASVETRSGVIDLSGTSQDIGEVTRVFWTNSRGGTGAAEGLGTWSANGIALQPGVNFLTITAEDAAGNSGEDTISVTYTPYDADADGIADDWEMEYFGELNIASAETDYGNSGVNDFVKYAFGIVPTDSGPGPVPYVKWVTDGFESPVLNFRRLIAPIGLTYAVDVSVDGVNWDSSGSKVENVGIPTPSGDGVSENAKVRLLKEAVPTIRFYRLNIRSSDSTSATSFKLTIPPMVSSVSTLRSLLVSAGTLNPDFSSGTSSYSLSVANKVTSIKVTPTVTSSGASVKVNGVPTASGSSSATIPLIVGSNMISVLVTAQNGTTTKTYTVKITRAKSSNASLSALFVKSASLSPVFKPAQTSYSATVSKSVKSVKIKATAVSTTAKIKINGSALASGSLSKALPLKMGKNLFKIVVTAQDGTIRTYKITINRGTSAKSALAAKQGTAVGKPLDARASKVAVDGQRYQKLTVVKPTPGFTCVIEVSPDLVNWSSGDRHTTTMMDNDYVLTVRDNTPVKPGDKRFIRVRPGR